MSRTGCEQSFSGISWPEEERRVSGSLDDFFLQTKEGFLALSIEERHVDVKDA